MFRLHAPSIVLGLVLFALEDPTAEAHYGTNDIWPTSSSVTYIPVCFDSSLTGLTAEKAAVRQTIEDTWQTAAWVSFTGWGTCSPYFFGQRVHIYDGAIPTADVGYLPPPVERQITLDFNDPGIAEVAIHEFGHILGFYHEHERPDSPGCTIAGVPYGPVPWANATTRGLRYDPYSVMNYCDPRPFADTLSFDDFVAIQQIYGAKTRNVELSSIARPASDPDVHFTLHLDDSHRPAFVNYQVVGAGGFDSDANADAVFWYPSNNYAEISCTDALDPGFNLAPGEEPYLIGDFNGDDYDDIVWYEPGVGNKIWQNAGTGSCGGTMFSSNLFIDPSVAAWTGDFDGDGADDIFHSQSSGSSNYYFQIAAGNGAFVSGPAYAYVTPSSGASGTYSLGPGAAYSPVVGDFNGDGLTDVVWRGPVSFANIVWEGTGNLGNIWRDPTFTSYTISVPVVSGTPVVGRFQGDAGGGAPDDCDDVVWYRPGLDDGVWVSDCSGAIGFNSGSTQIRDDYVIAPWEDQLLLFGK